MSSVNSAFHRSSSHQPSAFAPIFGRTEAAWRFQNLARISAILSSSSFVDRALMRICFGADLHSMHPHADCSILTGSHEFMCVSVGDAWPPSTTFSGTISSSPPSIGGRLLSALASFLVIQGPPTELCSILARSSNDPFSFSVRSNSTYVSGSAPIIGRRKLFILCCSICSVGPRQSAYSALALSFALAYVCVFVCHIRDGLT